MRCTSWSSLRSMSKKNRRRSGNLCGAAGNNGGCWLKLSLFCYQLSASCLGTAPRGPWLVRWPACLVHTNTLLPLPACCSTGTGFSFFHFSFILWGEEENTTYIYIYEDNPVIVTMNNTERGKKECYILQCVYLFSCVCTVYIIFSFLLVALATCCWLTPRPV